MSEADPILDSRHNSYVWMDEHKPSCLQSALQCLSSTMKNVCFVLFILCIMPVIILCLVLVNSILFTAVAHLITLIVLLSYGNASLWVEIVCFVRPALAFLLLWLMPYPHWTRSVLSFGLTIGVLMCTLQSSFCDDQDALFLWVTLGFSIVFTIAHNWIPTSFQIYETSELKVLDWGKINNYTIVNNEPIAHIDLNGSGDPLVLVHGYCQTKVSWVETFGALREKYHLYSIDCPGNGGSTRDFGAFLNTEDAEDKFCEKFEAWRVKNGLGKITLCGHSMGGYLSACYAMKYPHAVDKLVLLSPVGLPHRPPPRENEEVPWRWRVLRTLWGQHITPQQAGRWVGPFGERFVRRIYFDRRMANRGEKFREVMTHNLYHSAAGPVGYERFLYSVLGWGVYAQEPLAPRLREHLEVPTAFIYGDRDWMSPELGQETAMFLKSERGIPTYWSRVEGTTHQVYFDNPDAFSKMLLESLAVLDDARTDKKRFVNEAKHITGL